MGRTARGVRGVRLRPNDTVVGMDIVTDHDQKLLVMSQKGYGKVTKVDGNLTLLGKTNPVSLKATKFNCYNSPMLKNAQVCGGDFETTIDRTKWGMDTYVKMGFAKDVKLNIQVEAVQQ